MVMIECGRHPIHMGEEAVVLFELLEPLLFRRAEQADRAMVEGFEEIRVNAAEQGDGVRVPAPPQVVRKRLKSMKSFGQARQNSVRPDRSHRHTGTSRVLPGGRASARGAGRPGPEYDGSSLGRL